MRILSIGPDPEVLAARNRAMIDDSLDPACLDFTGLEPAPIDLGLNLGWGNMKRNCQRILGEAIPAHGQLGPHRWLKALSSGSGPHMIIAEIG